MTDNAWKKQEWRDANLPRQEPASKIDRCSKCGKRRPVSLMAEIGFQVYACRQCLMN